MVSDLGRGSVHLSEPVRLCYATVAARVGRTVAVGYRVGQRIL